MGPADILITLTSSLDDRESARLTASLGALPGVGEVRQAQRGGRLFQVFYDPARVRTRHLLDTVQAAGHDGFLIGA